MREDIESEARSYCLFYPARFVGANGSYLIAETGDKHLDFLAGCGSLNYGHNGKAMQSALQDYISNDGFALGSDLRTRARQEFIDRFELLILRPRSLEYRIRFTGPTGANAVEAAIKLARKVTGRSNITAFTNAFHGCSLGALALTANFYHRGASASMLHGVHRAMYDGYLGLNCDTSELLRKQLSDPSGVIDRPAAVILDIVQAEGGRRRTKTGRNQARDLDSCVVRKSALRLAAETAPNRRLLPHRSPAQGVIDKRILRANRWRGRPSNGVAICQAMRHPTVFRMEVPGKLSSWELAA
ncbi:aminotransferase class III-fold pyridoxal phosphate-dependent enzyme [Mesorhizobium sp. M6A.T.Ce.TU.016.01.1.1]|uniref:aminotransferase class III-fold pyridoxal phosphate-dependent enzyme n=1 Tax=Mesorhizobium sp. M6A.T.Ce.TU.016.01.1.1 TaxID=2496783 RepID=UPI00163CCC25|nr:aminotransferase class III-fold pyridoxal phosphate-dependent enzyme [Mesorhizobium sp. M6A.T.Ce.TU.016.01.1.1]